ncbi:MAG: hypothetical protein ABIS38_04365 [Sphingomicrobium sp.]
MEAPPQRGPQHDALDVFLGEGTASGVSFGGTDQADDPRANGQSSTSNHRAFWHTGNFFMVQDERAMIAGAPFDTLSIMGVDPGPGDYFSRGFENHGFYRDYRLTVDGNVWQLHGETERATIAFSEDNRRQAIHWEWMPDGHWLPLCDRVAIRID